MQGLAKEVWLAGKGPSLDKYDWSVANKFRVGINESAFLIPDCFAAIAIDYNVLDQYIKRLDPRILVLRKITHINYTFVNKELWEPGVHVQKVNSTAPVAVQLLHHYGARIIHFVGFDSMGGGCTNYSDKIVKNNWKGTCGDGFKRINGQLQQVIDRLNIKAIWEHESQLID